jgi:steroid 5-alpha reductase family enzyme
MWIVSLPVQRGVVAPGDLGVLGVVGLAVWVTGLLFETIGDAQLARFKANPDNDDRVMDRGLWRYTRHPNYFGDFLAWWGMLLVAVDGAWALWWTAIGPIVMTVLLVRVSGVGLLEKTIASRRPGYDEYRRRTNAFFPGPPKS